MRSLKEKVVIITGASSGIGAACARLFSSRGAKVVLASRSEKLLLTISEECNRMGGDTISIRTDVVDEMQCKMLVEKTLEKYGRIDVLINNAGISMRSLFLNCEIFVLKKVMDTNFWGMVFCSKYALPHLLASRGNLVGISSVSGFSGLPGRSAYSASKFAIHGFLESLRMEHINSGFHVNIICPGFTRTEIRKNALKGNGHPQGETPRIEENMMSAEKVALNIWDAIEKNRKMVVLTPIGKIVFWLQKFFPGFVSSQTLKEMSREPGSPMVKKTVAKDHN